MGEYYVSMTDKFFSNWGKARGRINKLVIECETLEEAEIVEANAKDRQEMKYINIHCGRAPSYSSNRYYVSWHSKKDYPNFFRPGAFRGQ